MDILPLLYFLARFLGVCQKLFLVVICKHIMIISSRREAVLLFAGDTLCFIVSLWFALFMRFGSMPSVSLFVDHVVPFFLLFVVWVFVFFVAGLYEKHTMMLKSRLPTIIFNTQVTNSLLAVMFFYLIPYFGITPKTILFIYLAISFVSLLTWRMYGPELLGVKKKEQAILIGSGEEMKELRDEVNSNSRYDLFFSSCIDVEAVNSLDFQEEILKKVYSENIHVIAVDLKNEKIEPILPNLYNLIFSKVRFVDMYKIYEDIFDRVPLSLVKYNWFLENISVSTRITFDFIKRLFDIVVAGVLGVLSLAVYPFVFIAIKLDDFGPIFFAQERIGKNNKIIKIYKFRSMSVNEKEKITRIGPFLRKSRIDELPQLWNVLVGDISLIGPRPEMPNLVKLYEKEIPYYNIRHLITPGLSGWAQLYHKNPPKFDVGYDTTKTKLSYDLYYIKNRSIMLDFKIALKTVKAILSRSGV